MCEGFYKLVDKDGNLNLNNRNDIKKLPALKIKGNLYCYGCNNLTEIDPDLEVNGSLNLELCGISKLPSIKVGKDLN